MPETVYRPAYRRFVCLVYVPLALYVAFDAFRRLAPGPGLAVLACLVTVGVALYALAWRPSIELTDAGVLVRNVWSDVEIAWPAIQDVESRLGLRIHTAVRRVDAWAAPATRNPEVLAQRRRRSTATLLTVNPLASATQARVARAAQEAVDVAQNPGDPGAAGATTSTNAAAALVQAAWDRWKGHRAAGTAGEAGEAGAPASAQAPATGPGDVVVRWHFRLVVLQLVTAALTAVAFLLV